MTSPKPAVNPRRTRSGQTILAIASGGGHWVQLMRLRPAFNGNRIIYASTARSTPSEIKGARYLSFRDGNRDRKISLFLMAMRIFLIIAWYRPDRVISTGAACGYFACRFGRWFGAKTLFIDSLANAETLSLSAQLAQTHANQVISQWPDVAQKHGTAYRGSVL